MAAHKYFEKYMLGDVEMMRFIPDQKMKLFAMTLYCDKEVVASNPAAVCEAAGIPRDSYERFCSQFGEYFEEWLEDRRLALGGRNKKAALEAVGIEKALAGDFQFWKPLAIREGVIQKDSMDLGISIPSNLGTLKELGADDLKALENSIMATLRGESQPSEIVMAEGPEGWQRQSDPG